MPEMPQPAVSAAVATDKTDTAAESARRQACRFPLLTAHGEEPISAVTFHAFGAGAQRARGDESVILFTFPVHSGKSVRIATRYETAVEFWESLTDTLGGIDALRARKLKRGNRR